MVGTDKDFKMVDTSGNYYGLVLETRKEVESVLYVNEDKKNLVL